MRYEYPYFPAAVVFLHQGAKSLDLRNRNLKNEGTHDAMCAGDDVVPA